VKFGQKIPNIFGNIATKPQRDVFRSPMYRERGKTLKPDKVVDENSIIMKLFTHINDNILHQAAVAEF